MNRNWLDPLVRFVESWFDDSVSVEAYQRFLRRSALRLGRASGKPADPAAWAAEVSLALDNLRTTSLRIDALAFPQVDPSFKLPARDRALQWWEQQSADSLIVKGTVERCSAANLLTLLKQDGAPEISEIEPFIDVLLRHVELRRKKCLRLRGAYSLSERWFEIHDTAILLARWAGRSCDRRFINAAMKLNDWGLAVHRRSVPADLLARYMLSISEVQLAFEVLI
ncbi:MAG: hypothetical protein PVF85_12325 [Anaerolineales bacterium]|jgi:hypothetical protein